MHVIKKLPFRMVVWSIIGHGERPISRRSPRAFHSPIPLSSSAIFVANVCHGILCSVYVNRALAEG